MQKLTKYLKTADAADYLGISQNTLRKWAERGDMPLSIVSNRTNTWCFANNNARHFAFNAEERFLRVYQYAGVDNKKINHPNTR